MRKFYFVIFILLLTAFLLGMNRYADPDKDPLLGKLEASLHYGEKIIDYTREGKLIYTIISRSGSSQYGDLFTVFTEDEDGSLNRTYENDFEELKPWKLETGDIDGCGVKEILIPVIKTTHFDKTMRNRMFIFNYTEGKLVKKWTGSQIAGTWRYFYVGDLIPRAGEELIFIEQTEGGEKISVYYWFDFGFLKLAESGLYDDITDLKLQGNNLKIKYGKGPRKVEAALTVKGEKLSEKLDE